jgi:hypothetical protein
VSKAARIGPKTCAAVTGPKLTSSASSSGLDGAARAIADRSSSEQICEGSSVATRAAVRRHDCSESVRAAMRSGVWSRYAGGPTTATGSVGNPAISGLGLRA